MHSEGGSLRIIFFAQGGGEVVIGIGVVGFEINSRLEETDGVVVVFQAIEDAAESDSEVGIGGIEVNGLAVGGDSPGVGATGEVEKTFINGGEIFDVGDLGGVEGNGVFGFADGLLDELGDGIAFIGSEFGFIGGEGIGK